MNQDNNDRLREWRNKFTELEIDSPLSHPLYFKRELHIGEDAYQWLRMKKTILTAGRLAVAALPPVAATFFPATGIMAALGLGAAATPVGWVVLTAVLSGVAWTVIARKFDDLGTQLVDEIPKFINTPLDLLAVSIFDLLSPMFVKLAYVDGEFDELERKTIIYYFVECWGYNEKFARVGVDISASALTFSEAISDFIEFIQSHPDCNANIISQNVMAFLQEVAEASNGVVDRERHALLEAESAFAELQKSKGHQVAEKVGQAGKKMVSQVGGGAKGLFKSRGPRS